MQIAYFLLFLLVSNTFAIKNRNYDDSDDDDDEEGSYNSLSMVQTNSNMQTQAIDQFNQLCSSHPLGKMVLNMAEVNMKASGAVDTLIEVLKAFGRQMEERLASEQEIFDALLGEHTSKKLQLESLVNQAELDINREKKKLTQNLIPRSKELDDILVSLKSKKEANSDQVKSSKATRKDQQSAFNMFSNEISEAIRAVDEALESIKQMMSGSSFVQMTTEDKSVIQKKLHNIKIKAEQVGKFFGSFLTALSQISESQNFADKQVIKELVDLLNSLRGNFVETLQKAYADEDQQKLLDKQRMDQLANELAVFDKQYSEAIQEREEKTIMSADTQQAIETRSIDLKGYEKRLTTENNNFSQNQKIHDDLVASINEEIGIIEKSIDLLQSPVIKDYLQTKISKAK